MRDALVVELAAAAAATDGGYCSGRLATAEHLIFV